MGSSHRFSQGRGVAKCLLLWFNALRLWQKDFPKIQPNNAPIERLQHCSLEMMQRLTWLKRLF
jgi:hypothetical protein